MLTTRLRKYLRKLLAVLTAGLTEYVKNLPAGLREYVRKLLAVLTAGSGGSIL